MNTKGAPICPYCNKESTLVTGKKIYPHRSDLYKLSFYYCDNGHYPAYVGCHKGTTTPLGRLADSKLRKAKNNAHSAFDTIWRESYLSRSDAYKWLADSLGVEGKDCHIGMFDVDICNKVVALSSAKMLELKLQN